MPQRFLKKSLPFALSALTVLGMAGCSKSPAPGLEGPVPAVNTDACVEASQPWAKGFQADHCQMADGNLPPLSPVFWPDVCTPNLQGWSPTQSSFDQLSWRSFLFANWPADPSHPGQPDTGQPLGAQAGGTFLPTVWESFKNAEDLFGPGGENLTAADFASPSPVPAGCSADGPRVLTLTSKVPTPSILALAAADPLNSVNQAFRGPLVDQNGKLVFYEIRINETEYTAIVKAGAQKKSPAELNCAPPYTTPTCVPFQFPVGSIEVKVAWKQLNTSEQASAQFYSQTLQIRDPNTGTCSEAVMGLVGQHIAHKTTQSLNVFEGKPGPSWAWSTFEQANNVPPVGNDGSAGTYSFFNHGCQPAVTAAQCAAASPGNQKPNPDPQYQCCENLYRYPPSPAPVNPSPNQITRIDLPPTETAACNAVYDQLQRAVWDNYNLVTTQWPKGVEGPYPKVVTPTHARNTIIESYFTEWQNGQQVNQSSCMGCHFGSSAVDMSYLFLGNTGSH